MVSMGFNAEERAKLIAELEEMGVENIEISEADPITGEVHINYAVHDAVEAMLANLVFYQWTQVANLRIAQTRAAEPTPGWGGVN